MQSVTVPAGSARREGRWFDVLRERQTYRTLLYLLLLVPLTCVYLLALFIALYFADLLFSYPNHDLSYRNPFWLAVFLALVLAVSWPIAILERRLASWLLDVRFAPMSPPIPPQRDAWERLKAHLRNPVTWKALLYLILRVPFGFVVPLIAFGVLLVALMLLLAPLIYAVMWGILAIYWQNTAVRPWIMRNFRVPYFSTPLYHFSLVLVVGVIACIALGAILLPVALRMATALAFGWGRVAHALLGSGSITGEPAEARAIKTRGESAPPQRRGGWFGVLRAGRTYRSLFYLAILFPLSYIYGAILVSGKMAGNDFLWFVTYLVLVFAGSWFVAMWERTLARWLLSVRFTPMGARQPAPLSLWERLKAHVRNPVAWKSLLYLVLRVPFGFAAPMVALVLLLIPPILMAVPAVYVGILLLVAYYWLDPTSYAWARHNLVSHSLNLQFYHFSPVLLLAALLLGALGVFLFPEALRLSNALADGWGWVARQLLGISPRGVELAEARALTAQARTRAEHADQSRRDLILNASHELRTPIASVRAHLDSLLLLEGDQLPANVRSFIGIAQREVERLGALVDDLLMLARADSDRLTLSIVPVAVGEVVEEVYQALEPLARQEREITLVRHVAARLPAALADRDRLAQVLLNLVRNAITYTPSGGIVAIELAAGEGHTLALSVTDTGIGIAPEDSERVFERFYRADASRARNTGGTGLGLSIARDLVEAMGGSIGVEAIPEGGSRFRVVLRAAGA